MKFCNLTRMFRSSTSSIASRCRFLLGLVHEKFQFVVLLLVAVILLVKVPEDLPTDLELWQFRVGLVPEHGLVDLVALRRFGIVDQALVVLRRRVQRLRKLLERIEEAEELLPRLLPRGQDVVAQLEDHVDLATEVWRHVHRVLLTIQEEDPPVPAVHEQLPKQFSRVAPENATIIHTVVEQEEHVASVARFQCCAARPSSFPQRPG